MQNSPFPCRTSPLCSVRSLCGQLITATDQTGVHLLRLAFETIGANVVGVGMNKAVYIRLADDRVVVLFPTVGVSTSTT